MFDFNRFMNTLALFAILMASITPPTLIGQELERVDRYFDSPSGVEVAPVETLPQIPSSDDVIYGEPFSNGVVSSHDTTISVGEPFEGEIINIEIVSDVATDSGRSNSGALKGDAFANPISETGTDEALPAPNSAAKKTAFTHQEVVDTLSADLDSAVQKLLEIHSKPSPYAPKLANIEKQLQEINELSKRRTQALRQLNQRTRNNAKKFDASNEAISKLQDTVQKNSSDLKNFAGELKKTIADANSSSGGTTDKAIAELQSELKKDSQGLRELVNRVEKSVADNTSRDDQSDRNEQVASIERSVKQQNDSLKRLAEAVRKARASDNETKTTLAAIKDQLSKTQQQLGTSEGKTEKAISSLQTTLDAGNRQLIEQISNTEKSVAKATAANNKDDKSEAVNAIQKTVEQQNQSLKRLAEAVRKSNKSGTVTNKIDQTAKRQQREMRQLTEAVKRMQASLDSQSNQLAKTAKQVAQLQDSIKQGQAAAAASTATDQLADQLSRQSTQLQDALLQLKGLRESVSQQASIAANAGHGKHDQHSANGEAEHRDEHANASDDHEHSHDVAKGVEQKEETLKQLIKRIKKATE